MLRYRLDRVFRGQIFHWCSCSPVIKKKIKGERVIESDSNKNTRRSKEQIKKKRLEKSRRGWESLLADHAILSSLQLKLSECQSLLPCSASLLWNDEVNVCPWWFSLDYYITRLIHSNASTKKKLLATKTSAEHCRHWLIELVPIRGWYITLTWLGQSWECTMCDRFACVPS